MGVLRDLIRNPSQYIDPSLDFLLLLWHSFSTPLKLEAVKEGKKLRIRGSHNGFVLLGKAQTRPERFCFNYSSEYYICSSMTKQSFLLPPHNFQVGFISVALITQVEEAAGRRLASFRIILVICPPPCIAQPFLELQMYSSETGSWVDLRVHSECPICPAYQRHSVVLNATLHLLDPELGAVIAYDPYADPDSLRIIQLPADSARPGGQCIPGGPGYSSIGVSQGRLMYFEVTQDAKDESICCVKIWQLREDNQWWLKHSTTSEDVITDDKLRRYRFKNTALVSFHPFDPDVVYLYGFCFMSYNMKTRRADFIREWYTSSRSIPFVLPVWSIPFVLPVWPITGPPSLFI